MLDEFLKEVMVYAAGKSAENLVGLLNGDDYVNEFIIAKKMDLTINQTRNLLYKLSDYGLVSSTRKKDKKKGWYTYFWKIEVMKSMEFLKGLIVKNIEELNTQIKGRETKQFYICQRCNIEMTEEHALLQDFTCHECGDIFTLKDNSKLVKDSKKIVEKFENKIKLVDIEIAKVQEKLDKIKFRENKKQAKKVEIEKAEKKAIRDKENKKKKFFGNESVKNANKKSALRKSNKKIINKKVVKKISKVKAKSKK